jgi:peptidoglycan hydrolase-like protein with peptidoglycan-binding domain
MKRVILTLLASAAMAAPAFAAPNPAANPPQQQTQMHQKMQHQSQTQPLKMNSQGNQKQASNQPIAPNSLSRNQVRKLQTALNGDGFKVGRVDGVWGPHTRNAVEHFQKSKDLAKTNGQLTHNTLAALGVTINAKQQNNRG